MTGAGFFYAALFLCACCAVAAALKLGRTRPYYRHRPTGRNAMNRDLRAKLAADLNRAVDDWGWGPAPDDLLAAADHLLAAGWTKPPNYEEPPSPDDYPCYTCGAAAKEPCREHPATVAKSPRRKGADRQDEPPLPRKPLPVSRERSYLPMQRPDSSDPIVSGWEG